MSLLRASLWIRGQLDGMRDDIQHWLWSLLQRMKKTVFDKEQKEEGKQSRNCRRYAILDSCDSELIQACLISVAPSWMRSPIELWLTWMWLGRYHCGWCQGSALQRSAPKTIVAPSRIGLGLSFV